MDPNANWKELCEILSDHRKLMHYAQSRMTEKEIAALENAG